MPPRRRIAKRRYARKPRQARRRTARKMRQETCKMKETIPSPTTLATNTPYQAFVSLQNFPRALDIADNFQLYRITRVDYKYTPNYDTFSSQYQSGTSNASMTVPYFYSTRLTNVAPTTFSLNFLQTMGAKPRRLDDKTISVSYRPNINLLNSDGAAAVSGQSKPVYSPWLNTHYYDGSATPVLTMDGTPHFGHAFWVSQAQATLGQQVAPLALEITVHFEFKKPWDKTALGANDPQTQSVL